MRHAIHSLAPILGLALFAPWAAAQDRPQLPGIDKVQIERDVEYGKGGDVSLKLDIVQPKEKSEKPLPAIVFIHGGAWSGGNKGAGVPRVAPLVATGKYVGFSVGYRLSGVATWPAQIHDCKAAIRWVRANAEKYNVDPNKIGVWGSSAGGHLVSLVGTSGDVTELEGKNGSEGKSSRVQCVVDFCGPSDFLMIGNVGNAGNDTNGPIAKLLGGSIKEKQAEAKAASPVTHVSKDDPPFLIMHGTADNVVAIKHAEHLHEILQKAGVSSTFVKIDGGGHGFGGPEVNKRVADFLAKYLRGEQIEVSAEAIKQQVEAKK